MPLPAGDTSPSSVSDPTMDRQPRAQQAERRETRRESNFHGQMVTESSQAIAEKQKALSVASQRQAQPLAAAPSTQRKGCCRHSASPLHPSSGQKDLGGVSHHRLGGKMGLHPSAPKRGGGR